MAPNPKIKKACDAMKLLGISETKTRAFLRKLLKAYDNNWDFIEDEAYKVLLDAIFDEADAQVLFSLLNHFSFYFIFIFTLTQFSFLICHLVVHRKEKERRGKEIQSKLTFLNLMTIFGVFLLLFLLKVLMIFFV